MTNEELTYYNRHLKLAGFGLEAQQKLKQAKVLVIGAGGLGCPVLQYLATAGVGYIGIIDHDIVELHNLHRQILYNHQDVGKSKAATAAAKITVLQPLITCLAMNEKFSPDNALTIIREYDVVIDGTDNFETRYLVNDACVIAGKPLISGSINDFSGQLSVFNYQKGPTYRCLYPEAPGDDECTSCSINGVLNVLPGIIGTQMANEAIKVITGYGEALSGKVLVMDVSANQYQSFKIDPIPENRQIATLQSFRSQLPLISKEEIKQLLSQQPNTRLIDVREPWEFEDHNIGGENIPLSKLPEHRESIVASKTPLIFLCQSGKRSQIALNLFQDRGLLLTAGYLA